MNTTLSAAQRAVYAEAARCLQRGATDRAAALGQQLVRLAPQAADAHLILALALSEQGRTELSDRSFEKARNLAPTQSTVAINWATHLKKSGRATQALEVLGSQPETIATLTEIGLLQLRLLDYSGALISFSKVLALAPKSVPALHGRANALRGLDDLDGAVVAYRDAIRTAPDYVPCWINLGAVLRQLGRPSEALECFNQAWSLGHRSAGLADARHGTLADLGRISEALGGARALVAAQPSYVPGQETLAHLLWEHGDAAAGGADPLAALIGAAAAEPAQVALTHKLLQLLLSAKRGSEALDVALRVIPSFPNDAVLKWFGAEAADCVGESNKARRLFEQARLALGGSSAAFLNALARFEVRQKRFDHAQAVTREALKIAPRDQQAWANQGLLWRLAGDAREEWLCGYEQLVGFVEVEPPATQSSSDFLGDLRQQLDSLHLAGREPVNQSVRRGSQTTGRLFGRAEPSLARASECLTRAVNRWIATLPEDSAHPFLRRKQQAVRVVGSWSVKLWASGFHSNHIHPEGWMSSAFYVALPPCTSATADPKTAPGWIQFGAPMAELGLDLPPRRLIQPKPGYLALFPSYLWHGTVPFSGSGPRMTIAFDMQPSKPSAIKP